jgi:tetratricopeptide (TPR) repeat protein
LLLEEDGKSSAADRATIGVSAGDTGASARARSLLAEGRLAEAAVAYEALCTEYPKCWEYWSNLAYCRSAAGEFQAALAATRTAFECAPDEPLAKLNLGGALIDAASYCDMAEEERRALAREGIALCDNLLREAHDNARILYNKANGLMVLREYQEAKKMLQAVVRLAPDWDEALVNLGNALKALGRGIEALDWYKRVLDRNPAHWEALVNMGHALAVSSDVRHVVQDAIRYLDRGLAIRPEDVRTLRLKAHCEFRVGDETGARRTLGRILAMVPSDEFAAFWKQQLSGHINSEGQEGN